MIERESRESPIEMLLGPRSTKCNLTCIFLPLRERVRGSSSPARCAEPLAGPPCSLSFDQKPRTTSPGNADFIRGPLR